MRAHIHIHRTRTPLLPLGIGILLAAGPSLSRATEAESFFETRVRPVLHEHCVECHGPEKQKGGLRLDSRDALLKGGESGAAVSPGNPAGSLLLKAVRQEDPDLKMPPAKSGPRLPDAVIADLQRWVETGAAWPNSPALAAGSAKPAFDLEARKRKLPWIWEAPRRQKIPAAPGRTEVDRFLAAKLQEKGIAPAPPTDDLTWLRRVHFAITGLPPRLEEIAAFESDESRTRRERVVDTLLASPHFGERWARHWMDLMRYAESRGHEGDYAIANAWRYRDYLIGAFNSDVPYNQFVREHVAGDLLPAPRLRPGTDINESVLATGWAFLGEENHSPVDIRQDECERIDNKVDVFSKAFLGLTISCARCHDHKFDPIRSQDYYALTGFLLSSSFRQVRFEAMENNRQRGLELATLRARWMPRIASLTARAGASGVGRIADYLLGAGDLLAMPPEARQAGAVTVARRRSLDSTRLEAWASQLGEAATNALSPLHLFALAARDPESPGSPGVAERVAARRPAPGTPLPTEARVVADFTTPAAQPWKVDGEAFGAGPVMPGDLVPGTDAAHPIARVMVYGAARRDLFWNRLKLPSDNQTDSGALRATARAGQMLRTPTVKLGVGRLHYLIRGRTRAYAAVDSHLMIEGPLHGRLVQVFDSGPGAGPRWVTHDLTPYSGHRVHVEFGPEGDGELEILRVVESAETPAWTPSPGWVEPPAGARTLAEYAAEVQRVAREAQRRLERGGRGEPASPTIAALEHWLVSHPGLVGDGTPGRLTAAAAEYLRAEGEIAARVKWESHTALSLFDGTGVDENVLLRGKPFSPGPLAVRSLPAAFASSRPIAPTASSGRLELAGELTDPGNPVVARALVNRVWHQLFGRGIVASVDNFGALGERPTHPELLDHLAWEFTHEQGWSVKRLIRSLVLTEAFARSSRLTDTRAEELDPSNALLHRMPVRRLEGEVIRDALLTVSGRLNPAVGGAPMPVHLTDFLVGRGRPDQSGPLDGDGRRSLYTAQRRNFLPTFMQTFDTPTPFSTVGKRNVTNVPSQSLALMNDPIFHQQARVWAERLLKETGEGADPGARVAWLFRTAYGRPPARSETAACVEALDGFRGLHPAAEEQRLEPWVDLCHALLNANDFIYVK